MQSQLFLSNEKLALFYLIGWVRENYPDVIIVGPCTVDAAALKGDDKDSSGGAGIGDILTSCTTGDLMDGCTEKLDVFSYHYYNGVSERMAALCPQMYTPPEGATSEEYLGMAGMCARAFAPYRDKYCPGGEMWVTESGDSVQEVIHGLLLIWKYHVN